MTSVARSKTASRPSIGRGLVLCNPASGTDHTALAELRASFPGHDVERCAPGELCRRIRVARDEGRPFVGIAGGDGATRTAADELAGSVTALLPIPFGTRNSLAEALGIETVDDAAKAADPYGGTPRLVDVGRVNGRSFVHNSSVGFYPGVVRPRASRRPLASLAGVFATVDQLRTGRRITVRIDGRPVVAWLVVVGNGCYGERMTDVPSRECLDENVLDVRVVRADHGFARVRLLAALVSVRFARTAVVDRRTCREIVIDVRDRREVDVALDGEVMQLTTPLRYRSESGALRVLVPN